MNRIRFMLIAAMILLVGIAADGWYRYRHASLELPESPVRVRVERGMTVSDVARAMRGAGIDVAVWRTALAARLRGDARSIRHGVYEFGGRVTLAGVLDRLVRGDVLMAQLTVVEGWAFRQMREAVGKHADLLHDSLEATDAELLARIGATEQSPEGLFFPDTYRFSPGASDYDVFREAYRMMQRTLAAAWDKRQPDLPVSTPYQALVLASIVEKETGKPEDRRMVASVFVNRLRIGMPLQSDPTTIYGLGHRFDGNLRREHLRADTPHNTYTRAGLPPTPIALPGKASIEAALAPAQSKALYFVARGDGSSEFSNDLAAHNRAVARYQLRK